MTAPSERPAEEAGRGDHNDLGYRNTQEERAYDEAGEQSPPAEEPRRDDDETA